MRVILRVACVTGCRQRNKRSRLLVTVLAGDLCVRTTQREVRIGVVVEVGKLPATGNVTIPAFVTVAATVHVVFLVTADTIAGRVVETLVGMTALARNLEVLSDQIKAGERVGKL